VPVRGRPDCDVTDRPTRPRYGRGGRSPADARDGGPVAGARIAGTLRSVPPVKVPFVPGPSDVRAAVDGVRDGLGEALELVPRLFGLVEGAERLVGRAGALLGRVEGVVDRVDGVVDRVEREIGAVGTTRARADEAIAAVGRTNDRADQAITAVGRTTDSADQAITAVGRTTDSADQAIARVGRTTDRADGLLDRVDPLVGAYEQPLTALAPSLRRLAETLEPDEVEAVVRLVDQLPALVDELERNVVPVLGSLDNVGDDVHDLLDTMQDLRQVVKGFPGSRLFRRRGAEEIAADEETDTGT
jgi:ABC-type transporter Mla subunit MlaD